MKRKLIDKLIEWKDEPNRKPALLNGVKGVGKTYLSLEFAKTFFSHVFYLNFETQYKAEEIFSGFDSKIIHNNILQHFGLTPEEVDDTNTIFIFDEFSAKPQLYRKIQEFIKHNKIANLLLITSDFPSLTYDKTIYQEFTLYPISFDEFLLTTSNEWYVETIKYHYRNNKPIPAIVHKELLSLFELYLHIGGMPSSVNEYLSFTLTENLEENHAYQLHYYMNAIDKNYDESDALKMKQVLQVLGLQLMKDNRKFQYRFIRKGTTQSMYQNAIDNLSNSGIVIPCRKIDDVSAYLNHSDQADIISNSSFKLYLHDTGLLFTNMIMEHTDYLNEVAMRGLLENFVAQTLHTNGYPLYYWESDTSARVEFLLPVHKTLIPVEVRSNNKTRSKNISVLKQYMDIPYSIKISTRNFELKNGIKYVPYYATFCI